MLSTHHHPHHTHSHSRPSIPDSPVHLPPLHPPPLLPLPIPQVLPNSDGKTVRARPLPLEPPSGTSASVGSAAGGGGVELLGGVRGGILEWKGVGGRDWLAGGNGSGAGKKDGSRERERERELERSRYPRIIARTGSGVGKEEEGKERDREKEKREEGKKRRARVKWTEEETSDLYHGVKEYGVGNWMKILKDPRYSFNNRSSVDLKDRFRTLFPDKYTSSNPASKPPTMATAPSSDPPSSTGSPPSPMSKPRARTRPSHTVVLTKLGLPIETAFPKAKRKSRLPFTPEEDERLLRGYSLYGAYWTKIHLDPELDLGHRRSTDLRDRFRTRFPEKYAEAGFKARPKVKPNPKRSEPITKGIGPEGENSGSEGRAETRFIESDSFGTTAVITLPQPVSMQQQQQQQGPSPRPQPPSQQQQQQQQQQAHEIQAKQAVQQDLPSLPPPTLPQPHSDPITTSLALDDLLNSTSDSLPDSPPPSNSKDDHPFSFLINSTSSIFDLPSLPPLQNPSNTALSGLPAVTLAHEPPLPLFHLHDPFPGMLDFDFGNASSSTSAADGVVVGVDTDDGGMGKVSGLGWEDLATRPIFDLGGLCDDGSGTKEEDPGRKRRCLR